MIYLKVTVGFRSMKEQIGSFRCRHWLLNGKTWLLQWADSAKWTPELVYQSQWGEVTNQNGSLVYNKDGSDLWETASSLHLWTYFLLWLMGVSCQTAKFTWTTLLGVGWIQVYDLTCFRQKQYKCLRRKVIFYFASPSLTRWQGPRTFPVHISAAPQAKQTLPIPSFWTGCYLWICLNQSYESCVTFFLWSVRLNHWWANKLQWIRDILDKTFICLM